MNSPYPARQVVASWRHTEEAIAEIDATSRARDLRRRLIAAGLDDPGPQIAVDVPVQHPAARAETGAAS